MSRTAQISTATKKGLGALLADFGRAIGQISSSDDIHSFAASAPRGLRGIMVTRAARERPPRPARPLELFEFERCPFCRKVREVLTELDLQYIARTCAKGAEEKRADVEVSGGERKFPYLRDPNTGVAMYESEEIITYLADTYGPGRSKLERGLAPVRTGTASAASLLRRRGHRVRPGLERRAQPAERPVLYNMEGSPYCRKVRETLNELNLDYVVQNVGKESARRAELIERGGNMQVPYLVDANTGTALYESDDIIAYLESTYGAGD